MNFTGKRLLALFDSTFVSDIAVFVLKKDVKLQLTHSFDSTWPIIRLRVTLCASNAAHGEYRRRTVKCLLQVVCSCCRCRYFTLTSRVRESTYLSSNIGLHKAKIWRLIGLALQKSARYLLRYFGKKSLENLTKFEIFRHVVTNVRTCEGHYLNLCVVITTATVIAARTF